MKKILCLIIASMSFAASAFAAVSDLVSGAPTTAAGMSIRGGADAATAANAATPLIKFSTGVFGMVNFTAASNLSSGYIVATRHITGSKNFATTNSLTNIYWKQAGKAADATACRSTMITEITTATDPTTLFSPGKGWTSY